MSNLLLNRHGSVFTATRQDARAIVSRLRAFLDCRDVWFKRVQVNEGGTTEYDWVALVLPAKHHVAARAFVEGWTSGRSDGLDLHYGRGYRLTEIAEENATRPFEKPKGEVPTVARRPTLAMIRALAAAQDKWLVPWDFGSATISALKKSGWITPRTNENNGGTQYGITEAGTKVLAEARGQS